MKKAFRVILVWVLIAFGLALQDGALAPVICEQVAFGGAYNRQTLSPRTRIASSNIVGYLFDPAHQISKRENLRYVASVPNPISAEEVIRRFRQANKPLVITVHLRGFNGPGAGMDLPEIQKKLTKKGAVLLSEIPSTSTLTSEFSIKIKFSAADDPNVIEYVAPDYGIREVNPYVVKGKVGLIDGKTPRGQMDGPAYIFANIFGLRGIRMELKDISPMALAGGMESSNAFNVALFAAASTLSGANWTWADIFAEAVRVENEVFGGSTGGQGHLSSILGGVHHHIWLSGIKDENGNEINPYGAFSIPFVFDEADIHFIENQMALLQVGKEYRNGKPVVERISALTSQMRRDLLRDGDEKGMELNNEALALSALHAQALEKKDMKTIVEMVNRYVHIRDELCRRWMKLAIDSKNNVPNLPPYAERYAQRLQTDEALRESYNTHRDGLAEISLYSHSAKALIEAGREEEIAIMPLGAGGPGAVNMAITSDERGIEHLRGFFERNDIPQLTDEGVRRIIRGTGELKGYMPFKVGTKPIQFLGFKELGFQEPAMPQLVGYNQKTGNFVRLPVETETIINVPFRGVNAAL